MEVGVGTAEAFRDIESMLSLLSTGLGAGAGRHNRAKLDPE